jgi:ATP-binding cassette subfamily B protein
VYEVIVMTQEQKNAQDLATLFPEEEILKLEDDFVKTYLKNELHPFRTLAKLYLRYWRQLLLSLFFYVIKTSPVLVLPIVTANIINLAVQRPENAFLLAGINLAVIVALLILNVPTHMLYVKYHSIAMRHVEAGLRGAMVRKLQRLSISFHQQMQSGRIQSKLMRDVETVQTLSSQLFSTIPGVIINLVTAMVVVLTKSLPVFVFFILCVPASVLIVRSFRGVIRTYNSAFRKNMESTSADLLDMVEMTPITRAHALEEFEMQKMTSRLNHVAKTGYRLDLVQAKFGSVTWVCFNLFQLLCLAFSCYLAFTDRIAVGDISLYQSYFTNLTAQVSTLIGLMPILTKGMDSVASIGEILGAVDIEETDGKPSLPNVAGAFDFDDVHFSYQEDQPVLRGLTLHVRAGETIAIVGESGSGKSTLLNLILGFYHPQKGCVRLDGRDLSKINLSSYRRHLAVVPQNSVLFSGTIRENITYGLPHVTEAQLTAAICAAHLQDLISSLPQGLDTRLDEHGSNLSGGQRQRISIARAIIRDPQVILFDEATSALDSVSEKKIQQAIQNLTANRTTFIVAHRLSTIRNADRIAVMQKGVCVELGTYEELMAKGGVYYKMQSAQNGVETEAILL